MVLGTTYSGCRPAAQRMTLHREARALCAVLQVRCVGRGTVYRWRHGAYQTRLRRPAGPPNVRAPPRRAALRAARFLAPGTNRANRCGGRRAYRVLRPGPVFPVPGRVPPRRLVLARRAPAGVARPRRNGRQRVPRPAVPRPRGPRDEVRPGPVPARPPVPRRRSPRRPRGPLRRAPVPVLRRPAAPLLVPPGRREPPARPRLVFPVPVRRPVPPAGLDAPRRLLAAPGRDGPPGDPLRLSRPPRRPAVPVGLAPLAGCFRAPDPLDLAVPADLRRPVPGTLPPLLERLSRPPLLPPDRPDPDLPRPPSRGLRPGPVVEDRRVTGRAARAARLTRRPLPAGRPKCLRSRGRCHRPVPATATPAAPPATSNGDTAVMVAMPNTAATAANMPIITRRPRTQPLGRFSSGGGVSGLVSVSLMRSLPPAG
jgi:hypothetical protein